VLEVELGLELKIEDGFLFVMSIIRMQKKYTSMGKDIKLERIIYDIGRENI